MSPGFFNKLAFGNHYSVVSDIDSLLFDYKQDKYFICFRIVILISG